MKRKTSAGSRRWSRKVLYLSNTCNDIHTKNTNTDFRTTLEQNTLINFPAYETLTVALTFMTITLPSDFDIPESVFAVKSNFSTNPVIRSSYFDEISTLFSYLNWYYSEDDRTITIKFETPLYFDTTISQLMDIHFTIWDLYSNSALKLEENAAEAEAETVNTPSIIGVKIMGDNSEIKKKRKSPFNILLESRDVISKEQHKSNNDSSFRITLPTRLEFSKPGWAVAVKSLYMSNRIWNIPTANDFWIEVEKYHHYGMGGELDDVRIAADEPVEEKVDLEPGFYDSLSELVKVFNENCVRKKVPIKLIIVFGTSITFSYTGETKGDIMSKFRHLNLDLFPYCMIKISPKLAHLLGFSSAAALARGEVIVHDFFPEDLIWKKKSFTASRPANIWVFHPKQICIQCDIVESSLIGQKYLQSLQCMSIVEEREERIMHFSFSNDDDDYVGLESCSFDTIQIRITDLNNNCLKMDVPNVNADTVDNIGTVVQLTMSNVDLSPSLSLFNKRRK